jgi:transposase-like protein
MSSRKESPDAGRAEPGLLGGAGPASPSSNLGRRYTPDQRRMLLAALASSGQTQAAFCAEHHVSTASLCAWLSQLGVSGPPVVRASWSTASVR